jgi:hypothetical protein
MKGKFILYWLCVLFPLGVLPAQPIFIDQPIQCGDLIVFPHITDSTKFYYLANKIRLGVTTSGKPQFSFLRYVQNVKTAPGGTITNEGEGGGIVHALVELYISDQQKAQAQAELRKKMKRPSAVLMGPVIYKGGTFSLVSSFAEEGSEFTKKVIGVGRAPVFVGNKAAVSIRLTKLGAKILWESCQTPTPDLSFSFIMDLAGYRSPMQARIEVNWDKVYEHEQFDIGVGINAMGIARLGADIKLAFDQLREDGTIKVINFGADDKMEAIIDAAYKKILDMMFSPFSMPNSDPSTIDQLADGFNKVAQTVKQNSALVSVNFGYELKKQKKSGMYVIDLSKATTETINFRFDENLGSEVAKCKECFRSANLDDPFYKQREILVSIDGLNSDQFNKYINFVTVTMNTTHGGGEKTTDEVFISQPEFLANAGNAFHLLYGWKDAKDADRTEWLKYDYKTVWSFFGGHTVDLGWQNTDQLGLNVTPPFHPMSVSVEADPALLSSSGIRVATVKFFYDYGAGEKIEQVTLKGTDPVPAQLAEFMLKQDQFDYEYEVTWRLFGNKSLTTGRKKSSDSLLYVDEIPADAIPVTN